MEDCEFQSSLGYIVRTVSKQQQKPYQNMKRLPLPPIQPQTTTSILIQNIKALEISSIYKFMLLKRVLPSSSVSFLSFSRPILLAVLESCRNLSHTAGRPVSRWLVITLSPPQLFCSEGKSGSVRDHTKDMPQLLLLLLGPGWHHMRSHFLLDSYL